MPRRTEVLDSMAHSLLLAAGWEERRGWIPPEHLNADYTDGLALWNAIQELARRRSGDLMESST